MPGPGRGDIGNAVFAGRLAGEDSRDDPVAAGLCLPGWEYPVVVPVCSLIC